jgi:GT2 family glycosyltransferase
VLREERPDLCGGPYFPYYVDPKPRWYLDRYNSDGRGDEARALGEGEFVNGTNMIWRRERVEQLGGFRGDLGVTARGAARGGETNLIIRGRQEIAGFKVWYHPGMIVYHLTRPGAMSLGYSIRQLFATGRKHNQVFNITKHDLSRPRLFLRLLQTAGRLVGLALGALLYRDRKRFPFWQNAVYERMLPEFYRLGRLWEGVVHWRSSCAGIARQDPANVGSSECRATVASRSPSCS